MKLSYKKNRPFINSLLFGITYLVSGILLSKGQYFEIIIGFQVIIPGVIFPLITNKFNKQNKFKSLLYLCTSCIIYLVGVYSYAYNDHTYNSIIGGSILSSFLYQNLTKFFFETRTSMKSILVIAILSGLSFLPLQIASDWNYGLLGLGIFFWVVINSIIPNNCTTANSL